MRGVWLAGALLVLCGTGSVSAADLAPTGTLRAAFLATNPVQARVNAQTGEVTGPVADLVRELARRLGVPFVLIPAPDARAVIEHVQQETADLGFLAYETQRAREVEYAGAFAVMLNHFLVPAGSRLQRVADVDQPGHRVGAVRGQSQQIHLSATLRQARVVVLDSMPEAIELQRLLLSGELDAFGLNAQRAEDAVAATGTALRTLAGSFLDVEQSFVVKRGDPEKVDTLKQFAEELRESGFLRSSIERASLTGGVQVPSQRQR